MADTTPAHYWDTSCFIAHLNGETDVCGHGATRVEATTQCLDRAARGELRIYTSVLSTLEVAGRGLGATDEEADRKVLDLFRQPYITQVQITEPVSAETRRMVRAGVGGRSADVGHIATAVYLRDVLEVPLTLFASFDGGQRNRAATGPVTALTAAEVPFEAPPLALDVDGATDGIDA